MPALKKTIKAVHVADLDAVLDKLGMGEAFRNGEIRCAVCADTVVHDNAGSIKFTNGMPSLVCSKVACYGAVMPAIMGGDTEEGSRSE